MDKETLLIFPFNKDCLPVIKQISAIERYVVKKIVTPKSVLPDGADIGGVQNRTGFGFFAENSFESAMSACGTVLALKHEERFKRYVHENLALAVKEHKKIILMFEPDAELAKLLDGAWVTDGKGLERHGFVRPDVILPKIETPIVFVGGIYSVNSAGEIAVDITRILREKGYVAATVCNDDNLLLDDGYFALPDFLFSSGRSETEKIDCLKDWLMGLEKSVSPDIIILTVPDAMMVMGNKYGAGYCVYPFLVSAAVTPDYFVLDAAYGKNQLFYGSVSDHFLHRFGYGIDYAVATNMLVDTMMSGESMKLHYNYLPAETVFSENPPQSGGKISETSILTDGYAEDVVARIIEKLV